MPCKSCGNPESRHQLVGEQICLACSVMLFVTMFYNFIFERSNPKNKGKIYKIGKGDLGLYLVRLISPL